jgi:hypothetical protein
MIHENFVTDFIQKVNTVRNEEFEKSNFVFTEKIIEKKILNENPQEFKAYKSTLKKKALMEKNKPGNINKKEYETVNEDIDILEDDIFKNSSQNNNEEDPKFDIMSLETDKKIELIMEFIKRKNIILEEECVKQIQELISDKDFPLKKYINVSKIYQQITKVGFIKKLENGSYVIDATEKKATKTKKYFLNKL